MRRERNQVGPAPASYGPSRGCFDGDAQEGAASGSGRNAQLEFHRSFGTFPSHVQPTRLFMAETLPLKVILQVAHIGIRLFSSEPAQCRGWRGQMPMLLPRQNG